MEKLRILHISDIHFTERNNFFYKIKKYKTCNLDVFQTLAEYIFSWKEELDAILITGDIGDTGLKENLEYAIQFFEAPPASSTKPWQRNGRKATLNFFTKPKIILPGNHDRYKSKSFMGGCWPNSTWFDTVFQNYWDAGIGRCQVNFIPDEKTPLLAIISGDFSLIKFFDSTIFLKGVYGQGRVYQHRLNRLIELTERVRNKYPSCGILWQIHFAPQFEEFFEVKEELFLIDSQSLIDAASRLDIRYIFCGHTHNFRIYKTKNISILVAGSATCINNSEDTSIHIRDIYIDHGKIQYIQSKDYEWDPDEQLFKIVDPSKCPKRYLLY